jgi:hypothetical protein
MSQRSIDLLCLAVVWVVVVMGAALIAALGASILPLAVLWLIALAGAVLLAAASVGDDRQKDQTSGVQELAFIAAGLLLLVYLTAASVALGAYPVAAFLGSATVGTMFLLIRHGRVFGLPARFGRRPDQEVKRSSRERSSWFSRRSSVRATTRSAAPRIATTSLNSTTIPAAAARYTQSMVNEGASERGRSRSAARPR